MTEVPETYNELVELVENNDPGVVAQIIQENYTSNEILEEMADWMEKRAEDNKRKADMRSDDNELQALYDGIRIGRERSQKEIERKINR